MSTEADRLKEDVQRMLQGLPARGAERREPDQMSEDDLDDAKREARETLADEVKRIINETFTRDTLAKIATEKGLMEKIGQIGVREVAEEIRTALESGFESYLENEF